MICRCSGRTSTDNNGSTPGGLLEGGPLKALKQELVSEFERAYLESALRRSGGNIAAAARASGKPRRAFFELMRKRGVAAHECLVEAAGESEAANGEQEFAAKAEPVRRPSTNA